VQFCAEAFNILNKTNFGPVHVAVCLVNNHERCRTAQRHGIDGASTSGRQIRFSNGGSILDACTGRPNADDEFVREKVSPTRMEFVYETDRKQYSIGFGVTSNSTPGVCICVGAYKRSSDFGTDLENAGIFCRRGALLSVYLRAKVALHGRHGGRPYC
jgi:hypothetical protein